MQHNKLKARTRRHGYLHMCAYVRYAILQCVGFGDKRVGAMEYATY